MTEREDVKGGRHKMPAVTIKPIRPTEIEFNSQADMEQFINYATSKQKTHNEIMNRVRREMKTHQRSLKESRILIVIL